MPTESAHAGYVLGNKDKQCHTKHDDDRKREGAASGGGSGGNSSGGLASLLRCQEASALWTWYAPDWLTDGRHPTWLGYTLRRLR
jgi:hypothetical protein